MSDCLVKDESSRERTELLVAHMYADVAAELADDNLAVLANLEERAPVSLEDALGSAQVCYVKMYFVLRSSCGQGKESDLGCLEVACHGYCRFGQVGVAGRGIKTRA